MGAELLNIGVHLAKTPEFDPVLRLRSPDGKVVERVRRASEHVDRAQDLPDSGDVLLDEGRVRSGRYG